MKTLNSVRPKYIILKCILSIINIEIYAMCTFLCKGNSVELAWNSFIFLLLLRCTFFFTKAKIAPVRSCSVCSCFSASCFGQLGAFLFLLTWPVWYASARSSEYSIRGPLLLLQVLGRTGSWPPKNRPLLVRCSSEGWDFQQEQSQLRRDHASIDCVHSNKSNFIFDSLKLDLCRLIKKHLPLVQNKPPVFHHDRLHLAQFGHTHDSAMTGQNLSLWS